MTKRTKIYPVVEGLDGEVWMDVPEFEFYKVSNCGRVKTVPRITDNNHYVNEMVRKPIFLRKYPAVGLTSSDGSVKIFTIHRLVAKVFLAPPNEKLEYPTINHKDGNTNNNHVSNLEWMSAVDNNRHRDAVLNKKARWGVSWKRARKKYCARLQVRGIVRHLGYFENEDAAYAAYKEEHLREYGGLPY